MPEQDATILKEEHDHSQYAKRVTLISSATINAVVNTGASNSNVTLNPSDAFIGLTTTVIGSAPTLFAVVNTAASVGVTTVFQGGAPWEISTASLPTVSIGNNVNSLATMLNFVAPNLGNVTLNPSSSNIGSVSILGGILNANVSLGASAQYIGNVTTYPGRSMTTSFATLYSGAGNYTLFTPPNGQKWYMHNLMINSQGVSDGNIKSGANPMWPWAGLATYGGFAKTFTDSGLPANAVNDAFVVTLNSVATISISGTFHFE